MISRGWQPHIQRSPHDHRYGFARLLSPILRSGTVGNMANGVSDNSVDCPFCLAGAGMSATPVVYEWAHVIALFPLHPAAPGHTLVVPRKHVTDLWLLDPSDAPVLTDAVLRVAKAIRQGLGPDGLNIITSVGSAASQTVMHLHIHLVPRWQGDQFGDIWPRPGPKLTPDVLDQAAQSIHAAIGRHSDGQTRR
jgi:histidine triad (HIT) family protein